MLSKGRKDVPSTTPLKQHPPMSTQVSLTRSTAASRRRLTHRWTVALSLALTCLSLSAPAAVTGTKTALIMLVSLNDAPIDCSIGDVQGFYFTNQPLNVDSFYDHATWGNVRWAGNVIAVSVNFNKSPCNDNAWSDAADTA